MKVEGGVQVYLPRILVETSWTCLSVSGREKSEIFQGSSLFLHHLPLVKHACSAQQGCEFISQGR